MSGRMMAVGAGAAIGYVLGTRAGRRRYDELRGKAKQIWESDTLQEAAGEIRGQAGRLYDEGKKMFSDQADKMSGRHERGSAERNRTPHGETTSTDKPSTNPVGTTGRPTTLPPGSTADPTTLQSPRTG